MPGPKSNPAENYDRRVDFKGDVVTVAQARAKAKPNRKAAARLKARRESLAEAKGRFEHGFDMHVPGSQNRKK